MPELTAFRALVLLGEPGIGKSATLFEEAQRLKTQSEENVRSIHVDLRAFSNEALLHKRIFESAEFLAWASSDSDLVLHLDSLDEALLRIDSIANLLADEIPRHPTSRLFLRITCRTASWPSSTLEPVFSRMWGENAVGVFELAPLRREDVVAAAETLEIDPDSFLEQLYAANAVPFAIKPLTLNLLLALFKKDGGLPPSIAEIYSRGCLTLCEELNESRRDSRRVGILSAPQRLRLASRIAAVTMFANKYAIWTGPESADAPEEDIRLSALIGSVEHGEFAPFEIDEQGVRETLDTGLFTSRGSERMGWAHQGYAEFLAAQYLKAKNISAHNILKLLLHPSGGLIPQLDAVTAWFTSLDKDVWNALMQTEPFTLLQGDLTNCSNSDLSALTQSLLNALDENRANDISMGSSSFYKRLNHPDLASQLRPYIAGNSTSIVTRRVAILIAEYCHIRALQPDLLALATNQAENPYLRGRAVDALSTCGDDTIHPQLLSLARGELGPDPQDELKGNALAILWPKYLSTQELFALITRPNEGFVGAYVMFLTRTVPKTLTSEDLPVALEWATSFASNDPVRTGDFHRRSLADSIFVATWKRLPDPKIADPLLKYVLTRLRGYHDLFEGTGQREIDEFRLALTLDNGRRRAFVLNAARHSLDKIDTYHLMRCQLLLNSDLEWLLKFCPGTSGFEPSLNADTLCNFVGSLTNFDASEDFGLVYDAALKWPTLWQSFKGVFEGIPLDSDAATQLRQSHDMTKKLERVDSPLEPPPEQRIAKLLAAFEAGEWTAWSQLNRELTLTSHSKFYGSDFEYSIPEMPGWCSADAATKQRILRSASQYLSAGESSVSEWIGTNSCRFNDLAAFRALILLRDQDEERYRTITQETWAKWAAVAAAVPKFNGSSKAKFQQEVVADALATAPQEFVSAIRHLMQGERLNRSQASTEKPASSLSPFHVLRELEGCWDNNDLKQGVLEELQNPANSPDEFDAILDALLAVGFIPARDAALARMKKIKTENAEYTMAAATGLATYFPADAWPPISEIIAIDQEFARSFFLKMADNSQFGGHFGTKLSEDQLAETYICLNRLFPPADDPKQLPGKAHYVGSRESLIRVRDGIPREIVSRGSAASVRAMQLIVARVPDQQWLSFQLLEAQRTHRMKTWSPLSPSELLNLLASKHRTLVQSPADLCDLLVETLRKYERHLHGEQKPIRALWDRQGGGNQFRPVEEDSISDNVRLFLSRELAESGVVANREVEVSRIPGAPTGKRTDIKIDAVRRSADLNAYDTITAVIETKGCWNRDLFDSLRDQMFEVYMVTLRAPIGIYLVGWFDKAKWDEEDYRKHRVPNCTITEAQSQLDDAAAAIPEGYFVRSIVVDCRAP